MDKNIVIAFLILIAFLFITDTYIPDPEPRPQPKPAAIENDKPSQIKGSEQSQQQIKPFSGNTSPTKETENKTPVTINVPEKEYSISTELFEAVFSNKGGAIKSLKLKKYHPNPESEEPLELINKATLNHNGLTYQTELKEDSENHTLIFSHSKNTKTYTIPKNNYFFNLEIKGNDLEEPIYFSELSEESEGVMASAMHVNSGVIYSDKDRSYGDNSTAYNSDAIKATAIHQTLASHKLDWVGFRNKYFAFIVTPETDNQASHELSFYNAKGKNHYECKPLADSGSILNYQVFVGPLKEKLLSEKNIIYEPLFNYTGFNLIINLLLGILNFFNSSLGFNMGLSILMLTLTVKAVLFPLNLKAQTSMFMMSKLGPDIKALQEKYKNDRQALGMQQMKLFKDNGVNPLAGCLPMFIQMPVFISLFSTIGEGFSLRHAPFFGWINDLSSPDKFAFMEYPIPFINADGGTYLNLLVILYVVTMFIQQSMMPKNSDPQQAQMQKMMKFMMFGFAFILYNYSSGLMLYFVGSNILGMSESWYIKNRIIPRIDAKRQKNKK